MPTTTTRLALTNPVGADAPSELRLATTASNGILDNAALFLTGTLASRPAAGTYGRWYLATDDTSSGSAIGTAWFDNGSAWSSGWNPPSRGYVTTATAQSTTSASFVTLTTPDQVTGIVLPSTGLITVWYQATWQETVTGAAQAAIFVGGNQLKVGNAGAATTVLTAAAINNASLTSKNVVLASYWGGLASNPSSGSVGYAGDATTGQVVGGGLALGGPCYIFAAAGTYTVSVQFKTSSGTVTAQNRQLWVSAQAFS
jgi:hypothetical protein